MLPGVFQVVWWLVIDLSEEIHMGSLASIINLAVKGLGSVGAGDQLFATFLGSVETNTGSFKINP